MKVKRYKEEKQERVMSAWKAPDVDVKWHVSSSPFLPN